jgi:DNA-binding IclR family transcriptional regulator
VSSGSVAILSFLEEREPKPIMANLAPALKKFPADFYVALIERLINQTQRNGYALNPVLHKRGEDALGVPVLDAQGRPIAAFTLTAITARMTKPRIKDLVHLMQREAGILATAMGKSNA